MHELKAARMLISDPTAVSSVLTAFLQRILELYIKCSDLDAGG